jgi:hypothetical protein
MKINKPIKNNNLQFSILLGCTPPNPPTRRGEEESMYIKKKKKKKINTTLLPSCDSPLMHITLHGDGMGEESELRSLCFCWCYGDSMFS